MDTTSTGGHDYLAILAEIADASGGGTLTPPRTVHDCRDHEDNLVLDLAADVGALLVVSEDADLTSMPGRRLHPGHPGTGVVV